MSLILTGHLDIPLDIGQRPQPQRPAFSLPQKGAS